MLQQLKCFWTWPFGHVWVRRPNQGVNTPDRCFICGKDA